MKGDFIGSADFLALFEIDASIQSWGSTFKQRTNEPLFNKMKSRNFIGIIRRVSE
jgi:hypothetical protein